ncbi:MAG: YjiH family protein [Vreelandella alkaliphila]|uniref:YjiH family protein n=1 Tax=Halomonadaceae TaxID=28256 RepID=UPI000E9863B9|nr:YjiH family protein [Halomonas sp. 3D7M]HBS82417.1 hypothetical protein [Halomonas campaniensis]
MHNLEAAKTNQGGLWKAAIGSLIGILFFFLPIPLDDGTSKIPLVMIINAIKDGMGGAVKYMTLALALILAATWILSLIMPNSRMARYHKKDGIMNGILFMLSAFFAILLVFGIGPDWLLHDDVGGLSLYLGGSVFITVLVAGFFVLFLTEFGFLDFVGTLMEPLMRPLYRLPGRSAVDAIASFVAAPAVGIFLTNKLYTSGYYNQREAAGIATNFSICSLGFFALLATIGGITEYLPHMILVSFIINFSLAAVMMRIPPISRKKDEYYDKQAEDLIEEDDNGVKTSLLAKATSRASLRAAEANKEDLLKGFWAAATFAQKILAYVLSIATVALLIATYTPIFDYLGYLVEPIIQLTQLPDAAAIAPTILISIAEIALPAIIIAGVDNIDPMSVFFVCTLSTVQIIFFTESANAMLESNIPLTVLELVVIFLIRTALAIPLVAIATHLIF